MPSRMLFRAYIFCLSILLLALQACAPAGEAAVTVGESVVARATGLFGEAAAETAGEEAAVISEATAGELDSGIAGRATLGITGATERSAGPFLTVNEERVATDLLSRFCAGDDAAMGSLQMELSPPITRYFRGRLGVSGAESAELTQDVWLRVLTARNSGRCPQQMSRAAGWLFRVSENLATDLTRRSPFLIAKKTRFDSSGSPELGEQESEGLLSHFDVQPGSDRHLVSLCVEQVVASLAPLDRSIAMRLAYGFSQSQIARAHEVSPSTISRRVPVIKEALKDCE